MDNFKRLTICFIFLNAAMCYYDKITTFIFQLNITPKHFLLISSTVHHS